MRTVIFTETVTRFRLRPRHPITRRNPEPEDKNTALGLFAFAAVIAGAVQGGWGGAAIGFLIVVAVIGWLSKES